MGAIDAISVAAREALVEVMMLVAWADAEITPEEQQAGNAAALALGLVLPTDRAHRSSEPTARLSLVDASGLNERDRQLVYVCAEWMAIADETVPPAESETLRRLRGLFHITETVAADLRAIAKRLHDEAVVSHEAWWRAFDRLVVAAARHLAHRA